jgi:hypothetical protein
MELTRGLEPFAGDRLPAPRVLGRYLDFENKLSATLAAPGPAEGYLIVSDIEAARDELVAGVYRESAARRFKG